MIQLSNTTKPILGNAKLFSNVMMMMVQIWRLIRSSKPTDSEQELGKAIKKRNTDQVIIRFAIVASLQIFSLRKRFKLDLIVR